MVKHLRAGMAAAALLASSIAADAADLSMTPIYQARPSVASAGMPLGPTAGSNGQSGWWPIRKDSVAEKPQGFLPRATTPPNWLATLRRRLGSMLAGRWPLYRAAAGSEAGGIGPLPAQADIDGKFRKDRVAGAGDEYAARRKAEYLSVGFLVRSHFDPPGTGAF